MSHKSRLPANDKGDNGIIQGAVHKSPGIYLTVRENSGKSHLGDRLIKVMGSVIASNGIPYLQMMWLGPYSRPTSGREKERR